MPTKHKPKAKRKTPTDKQRLDFIQRMLKFDPNLNEYTENEFYFSLYCNRRKFRAAVDCAMRDEKKRKAK